MPLHSSEIKKAYQQARELGTLGGSAIWCELAKISWKCVTKTQEPDKKAVAYGLHHLFKSIWQGTDGRMVPTDRMEMFIMRAQDVFSNAINFLDEPSDDAQAIVLLAKIAELEIDSSF